MRNVTFMVPLLREDSVSNSLFIAFRVHILPKTDLYHLFWCRCSVEVQVHGHYVEGLRTNESHEDRGTRPGVQLVLNTHMYPKVLTREQRCSKTFIFNRLKIDTTQKLPS